MMRWPWRQHSYPTDPLTAVEKRGRVLTVVGVLTLVLMLLLLTIAIRAIERSSDARAKQEAEDVRRAREQVELNRRVLRDIQLVIAEIRIIQRDIAERDKHHRCRNELLHQQLEELIRHGHVHSESVRLDGVDCKNVMADSARTEPQGERPTSTTRAPDSSRPRQDGSREGPAPSNSPGDPDPTEHPSPTPSPEPSPSHIACVRVEGVLISCIG